MKPVLFTFLGILVLLILGWSMYTYITPSTNNSSPMTKQQPSDSQNTKDIILAGGCFWCVEADMEKLDGVYEAVSGYSGGTTEHPTYEDYASGGHREVVKVTYDPERVSYGQLIFYFLKHIDPTDGKGQFSDRGNEYAPAIYYQTEEQKRIAKEVLADIKKKGDFDKELHVPILEEQTFWKAEDYHQNYYTKNSFRYGLYRKSSGRSFYIDNQWGDEADRLPEYRAYRSNAGIPSRAQDPWANFDMPSQDELKQQLSDIQYRVTQKDATEPAFNNEYWNTEEPGIYVDVVSGEPLFSSKNKFESGTGWPSFTTPLEPRNVVTQDD